MMRIIIYPAVLLLTALLIYIFSPTADDRTATVVNVADNTEPDAAATDEARRKVVFIAGKPSHAWGEHEHRAGCLLLARLLNEHTETVHAVVVENGWPEDASIFEGADSIVIFADGGPNHPAIGHFDELRAMMDAGVGLVCLHYAVEIPKDNGGKEMLAWLGGYFETHWSVNPHWLAENVTLAQGHAITRGVSPFILEDEWYYHMRFRADMEDVTPIISAVPPKRVLARPDGSHSNNPAVRKRTEAGMTEIIAWAATRDVTGATGDAAGADEGNGEGRAFGLTGAHFHRNWGHDELRTLVLNAIAWTAHAPVPEQGIRTPPLTVDELLANQDGEPPANWNREDLQAHLDAWRDAE